MDDNTDITSLLHAWRRGERGAEDEVLEKLYPALKALALKHLSKEHGLTLQPTELVSEAYLKLSKQTNLNWSDRTHFLAIAGTLIRRVIIDYAKTKMRKKRGQGIVFLDLASVDEQVAGQQANLVDWITVDQFIEEIAEDDPRAAKIIELRFFSGLENNEIAEALNVSVPTIVRTWRFYRAWLHTRLQEEK